MNKQRASELVVRLGMDVGDWGARKHEKPELFEITDREQIAMLTWEVIGSIMKYLITE